MKKGFTLIELLAVIVILAIIAVIVVLIALNIINDTKESAVLRSLSFELRMRKSMYMVCMSAHTKKVIFLTRTRFV